MDTAVLERPVRQKTWHRTQGFEYAKQQVRAHECDANFRESFDDFESLQIRHITTKERIAAFGETMEEIKISEFDWGKPQGKEIW
jgi:hypothetical protein